MNDFVTASLTMSISRWWVEHRTAGLVLVYMTTGAVLAIPMLIADVPLGVDDLNHLARIYVRAHIDTDTDLARLFEVRTNLIPYVGMDLLLTPLARVLPIMMVGRLYILGLVWGLVGAVVVLQRVFTGRVGLGPAATGLIAYNGLIAWGLVNYMLGVILALLVFSAWHALRPRPWLVRLIVFSGASTVLYLTHLLAFVLYGILVASYEVFGRAQPWRTPRRDWLVLAGQAIPGLLLWSALSNRMSIGDLSTYYVPIWKLLAFESPMLFRGAAGGWDTGLLSLVFCTTALLPAARRGWLTWPRTLAAPVLVLLALTLILPFRSIGVALIDYRFSVASVCLVLAGQRLVSVDLNRVVPVAAAVALLMVMHVADVSIVMHRCDGQYAELREALAMLPRGVELTTVLEQTEPVPGVACTGLPIYLHMAQLITIDRSGYAADFFSRVTSVGMRGDRPTDSDPQFASTFTSAPEAGFVLWINLGRVRPVPPRLVLLWHGSFFDLWTVATAS